MLKGARGCGILLCAARLMAQHTVAIEGSVVDANTGIPVADAVAVLRYSTSPIPIDSIETGASGSYRFKVRESGEYAIEASAPGYLKVVHGEGKEAIVIEDAALESGADPAPHTINLRLSRSGSLTGNIRDAATGKPMSLITIRALRLRWQRGTRRLDEEAIAFSDESGDFLFESLTPGEYILEIQNLTPGNSKPGKKYPLIFREQVTVQPGHAADAGTIDYAPVLLSNLHGMLAAPCDRNTMYVVSIDQRVGGAFLRRGRNKAIQSCSAPFEISSLSPGSYRLELEVLAPRSAPLAANAPALLFGIKNIDLAEESDVDVDLKPLGLPVVSGRVVCDCDKPSEVPLDGIKLAILPVILTDGWHDDLKVNRDGTFHGTPGEIAGEATVTPTDLPAGLVLKSMVFNGSDSSLTLNPGSAATIEITLSDKPATVTGTASGAYVVIARWPLGALGFKSAATGKDGAFTLPNLAPGDYRAVTLTAAEWDRKDLPNAAADWFASSETITLAPKETKTLTLTRP